MLPGLFPIWSCPSDVVNGLQCSILSFVIVILSFVIVILSRSRIHSSLQNSFVTAKEDAKFGTERTRLSVRPFLRPSVRPLQSVGSPVLQFVRLTKSGS